jgi:hypothetical protein
MRVEGASEDAEGGQDTRDGRMMLLFSGIGLTDRPWVAIFLGLFSLRRSSTPIIARDPEMPDKPEMPCLGVNDRFSSFPVLKLLKFAEVAFVGQFARSPCLKPVLWQYNALAVQSG